MSSLKKVKRAQDLRKRKSATKSLKIMERAVNSIPSECSTCGEVFDPKVPDALSTWHVSMSKEKTLMTCPKCWQIRSVLP